MVSVIIITYNGYRYLEGCAAFLLAELAGGDEIVVVDNGSTDGGPDWLAKRYPQIVLIRNEDNCGFAAACNQGARAAAGDVLVFLNQDTRVEPGWRDGLVGGLDEREGIGLTTSKLLLMSRPERVQFCGQNVHYTGMTFNRGFLSPAEGLAERREVGAVSGASFAVRRPLWEELGGFDEIFFMYYEETDLSWRARQIGYRCLYTPDSVAFHDGSLTPPGQFQFYYFSRNRRIMILKNFRWPTLALLSPGLVLAEWIEWGLALASGWGGVRAKLRADLWVWTHLRQIAGRHAQAQAARRVSDAEILAERGCRMTPSTVTGGPVGRLATRVCDALFGLNYRLALRLCRALGL